LFFSHGFLGEIWVLNKIKQNVKGIEKTVGAGKEVTGAVKRGVGVGRSTGF